MIAMIDHLAGHAAVNTDVLARDEARFIRTEEHYHVGDIHGIAYPPDRLLNGIGPLINCAGCVNPAWGNGVDPDTPGKADSQRMGQGRYSAFGCGVTLGLGLAHAVAGRGDVHDSSPWGKVGSEKFSEVKRSSDSYAQRILELLVAALVYPLHQWQGIIDEIVHMAMFLDDPSCKILQHLLVGDVTHKVPTK